jgi:hypothetical protein
MGLKSFFRDKHASLFCRRVRGKKIYSSDVTNCSELTDAVRTDSVDQIYKCKNDSLQFYSFFLVSRLLTEDDRME